MSPGPIGIIGAGRVAQALGRLLYERGEPVVALAARNASKAARAAEFIGEKVRAVNVAEMPGLATRVLIAVSDAAIEPAAYDLALAGFDRGLALHTCGGVGPEALAPLAKAGVECGMLHPLQTIATPEDGVESLKNITFGIGGDPGAVAWAQRIAHLAESSVLLLDITKVASYHAAAAIVSNGLIALFDAALELMRQAGVNASEAAGALARLGRTTLTNAEIAGPRAALTGPVARGDAGTIARHLNAVAQASPPVADLYRSLTSYLLEIARAQGLPEDQIQAIQELLRNYQAG
ncbi:MAG TPA: DUF2520 domain-containing protein [Bryobacteraceae bacterium]